MADSSGSSTSPAPSPTTQTPAQPPEPKPRPRNPALRMLGLPGLPRKLPSRNWSIFWALTVSISSAIIYDRREKRRATARWAHAVSHLALEPLPGGSATSLPRKLTIFLASPPGDGLRVAQDHFTDYVKPVLAASGLDWEFVQGRMQGDIRASVAEKLRRTRKAWARDLEGESAEDTEESEPTTEEIIEAVRRRNESPRYEGPLGDIVIGRHAWKEYIRGLHEGWLGPLKAPEHPSLEPPEVSAESQEDGETPAVKEAPKRPRQPRPHNTTNDYPAEPLPMLIPAELSPSTPIQFPHLLGFFNTPIRMQRFFNRRALADSIGREVAAACLCTYREYRELDPPEHTGELQYEQQLALAHEEKDWVKSVWGEEKKTDGEAPGEVTEKIWPRPVILDGRIASRMRRFELLPEDEDRARAYIVPEQDIEGWIKGSLRQLYRWGVGKTETKTRPILVEDE